MANEEHLALLKQGADTWNRVRVVELWNTVIDLREANLSRWNLAGFDLSETNLAYADLSSAILQGVNLSQSVLLGAQCVSTNLYGANLTCADMRGADLCGARLDRATLRHADLSYSDLSEAILTDADLCKALLIEADMRQTNCHKAKLKQANLCGANLSGALLVKTEFQNAILTGCRIYGAAAWDLQLDGAEQSNIVISPYTAPDITVDYIEVAQFVHLLLRNEKIRDVIDTITSKAVLILGRFTPERKAVLDAIREELRRHNLLPMMFDFMPLASQTTLETVSTLAHMARFVIADLTDAKSVLQELQAIVPNNPSVPVQPLLLASQEEPGMFDFFRRFPWVLEPHLYHSPDEVLASLKKIIDDTDKARTRTSTSRTQRSVDRESRSQSS